MVEHLYKNWIVYVLMIGFIWFVASIFINARREENKGEQSKPSADK